MSGAAILGVAALLIGFLIGRSTAEVGAGGVAQGLLAQSPAVSPQPGTEPSRLTPPPAEEVRGYFLRESEAVGSLDENPSETEARLNRVAGALLKDDVRWLREQALAAEATGDERALAVELLSRSPSEAAFDVLLEFALRPLPAMDEQGGQEHAPHGPRPAEFERVLSARAIEGLGTFPDRRRAEAALRQVLDSTQDAFLADRARRNLQALSEGSVSAVQQDLEALRKLLSDL